MMPDNSFKEIVPDPLSAVLEMSLKPGAESV